MKTHAAPDAKRPCACGGSCGACAAKSSEPQSTAPAHPPAQAHNFADVAVVPPPRAADIPTADDSDDDIPDGGALDGGGAADGGVGAPGGGATATTDGCSQPFSMTKVTSGKFQNGLNVYSYFPDLSGRGSGDAGPFDTGTRVGSCVQLIGTFPSPCRPELFSLAQTVTYAKKVVNGAHDPKEGVAQDDIAKSGRDASTAPFRQDWLGGGYNASMADPPATTYSATDNIELDRNWTTSLVGTGGRKSVDWSSSIRIVNGKVTQNTVA